VLVAMTLANAMILVDQTAVPLALPNIMTSLHVSAQGVQWVLNGSLLPLAGLLVFGGRLGDLVGRRRVFTAGAILFAGASAVGALAPDLSLLIAARVAQGVGGALMLPTSVAIVSAA
jgi:MFS family permease